MTGRIKIPTVKHDTRRDIGQQFIIIARLARPTTLPSHHPRWILHVFSANSVSNFNTADKPPCLDLVSRSRPWERCLHTSITSRHDRPHIRSRFTVFGSYLSPCIPLFPVMQLLRLEESLDLIGHSIIRVVNKDEYAHPGIYRISLFGAVGSSLPLYYC